MTEVEQGRLREDLMLAQQCTVLTSWERFRYDNPATETWRGAVEYYADLMRRRDHARAG